MNMEKPYLIFEDLSAVGYTNIDRRNGFNIEHYKLVLGTAAKYHAATAVIAEQVSVNEMIEDKGNHYMILSTGSITQSVIQRASNRIRINVFEENDTKFPISSNRIL